MRVVRAVVNERGSLMPFEVAPEQLSAFQQGLIGTWQNRPLPGTEKGGENDPYSYNVMVLPQTSPQAGRNSGYVLKNFKYYETIVFKGPDDVVKPVAAPNRGGDYQQTPYVLFYDQQIRFAEGPTEGQIVHEENGAWLNLRTERQQIGPYLFPPENPAYEEGVPQPQPPERTTCKQISVPHGVSVLALGNCAAHDGPPRIPDAPSVLPTPAGVDTTPYGLTLDDAEHGDYENPHPDLTNQIARPLQEAIAALGDRVTHHIHCQVDSANFGAVVNIPFEKRKAALAGYNAEYWLLHCEAEQGVTREILAYTQRILLGIPLGDRFYIFPHPTSNVLSKVTSEGVAP
ncbi:heme-binding protein [Actinosynnema sp. NPDC059797]